MIGLPGFGGRRQCREALERCVPSLSPRPARRPWPPTRPEWCGPRTRTPGKGDACGGKTRSGLPSSHDGVSAEKRERNNRGFVFRDLYWECKEHIRGFRLK